MVDSYPWWILADLGFGQSGLCWPFASPQGSGRNLHEYLFTDQPLVSLDGQDITRKTIYL